MSGAGEKGFVKEIEGGGEQGLHSKLKKTTTNEKNVLPTADDIKAEKTAN